MHGNYCLWLEQFDGFHGVIRPHGIIIANRQQGVVDFLQAPQECHVAKKCCVTGEIEGFAKETDNKPGSMSTRDARTMEGRRYPDIAKIKGAFAAQMHAYIGTVLLFCQSGQFSRTNNGGACALGNGDSIAKMVAMTMTDQNVIAINLIRAGRIGRITGKKRVKQ